MRWKKKTPGRYLGVSMRNTTRCGPTTTRSCLPSCGGSNKRRKRRRGGLNERNDGNASKRSGRDEGGVEIAVTGRGARVGVAATVMTVGLIINTDVVTRTKTLREIVYSPLQLL